MARRQLEKWCESGLLILVVLILSYAHLATGGVRQIDRIVISGLTILAILTWVIRLWIQSTARILVPPVTWAILLFAVYSVFQYNRADVEFLARQEVLICIIAAVLFVLTVSGLHRQETTQLICIALILLGMLTSVYALYQYLTHSTNVWNIPQWIQYRDRASGTYINPNHFSGFLELVFPLCLALVVLGRYGHAPKIFMGYAAVVMAGGVAVTLSRGGWLAFGITLILFSVFLLTQKEYRNRGILLIVMGTLMMIGVLQKSGIDTSRFGTAFSEGKVENIRFPIWTAAVEIYRNNNPWIGVGPGHFSMHWFQYRPEQVQLSAEHVHNDYLELLVNWGIVGILLATLVLVFFFLGVLRTWKFVKPEIKNFQIKHSTKGAIVVGICFSMVALLIHSIVDFNLHIPANALLVSVLLGLAAGHSRFSTDSYWIRLNLPGKILLSASAFTVLGFLVFNLQREIPSELEIIRSGRMDSIDQKINHLEKAYEADSSNYVTAQGISLRLILEIQELRNFKRGNPEIEAEINRRIEQALLWLDRALELNPYLSKSLMWKGMCYHWSGREAEALPFFTQALILDPRSYFIIARYGYHFYRMKDYEEALKWLAESLRLTEFLSYYSVDPEKDGKYLFAKTYYDHVQRLRAQAADGTAEEGD